MGLCWFKPRLYNTDSGRQPEGGSDRILRRVPQPQMNHGSQRSRSGGDGLLLPDGPWNRYLGLFQIQEGEQEEFGGPGGDDLAGQPRDQPGGEHVHHDRWVITPLLTSPSLEYILFGMKCIPLLTLTQLVKD